MRDCGQSSCGIVVTPDPQGQPSTHPRGCIRQSAGVAQERYTPRGNAVLPAGVGVLLRADSHHQPPKHQTNTEAASKP